MLPPKKRKFDKIEPVEDDIFKHLHCNVCHNLFSNPKQLPECGHSFCYVCLLRLLQNKDSPADSIDCPSCCLCNELGDQGIEALPTNINLQAMSYALKQRTKGRVPSFDLEKYTPPRSEKSASVTFPQLPCRSSSVSILDNMQAQVASPRSLSVAICDESLKANLTTCCNSNGSASQTSVYCSHCKQNICRQCQAVHLELIQNEIAQKIININNKLHELPSAGFLRRSVDDISSKMSSELGSCEHEIADFAKSAFTKFSNSLSDNSSNLFSIVQHSVERQLENFKELVEKWSKDSFRQDVKQKIAQAYAKRKMYSISSFESIVELEQSVAKIEADINELEHVCRPLNLKKRLLYFLGSPEFNGALDDICHSISLGGIMNSLNAKSPSVISLPSKEESSAESVKSPFPLLGYDTEIGDDAVFTSTGCQSPVSTPVHPTRKELYSDVQLKVTVSGHDGLGWEMKKPSAICSLPLTDPLFAFIHNGTRITLLRPPGDIVSTFRIRMGDPFYLGQYICGDDKGCIYFTSCKNNQILKINIHRINSPKQVPGELLVSSKSPEVDVFSGLAINLERCEIYTATQNSIIAFSTINGSESFKIHFENSYQFTNSTIHAVFNNASFVNVIFTAREGRAAYNARFPRFEYLPAKGSSFRLLPLSKSVYEVSRSASFVASTLSHLIQSICLDCDGNLVVLFTNLNQVKMFTFEGEEAIASFEIPKRVSKDSKKLSFLSDYGESVFGIANQNSSSVILMGNL